MKKAAFEGGWGPTDNPRLSPSNSCCIALLVQGNREGWSADSYLRVAEAFHLSNPLASLRWAQFARGVS